MSHLTENPYGVTSGHSFGTSPWGGNLTSPEVVIDEVNLTSVVDDEYVYEYDYEASVSQVPLNELIPVAIVYGLTLIVGAVGNCLVIISIGRFRRLQNVTNIFLVSLASADLLLVSVCVPIKFAGWFTFTWTFGEFLCKTVHYLQNVSVICSVLTLTTMSLERYYAILKPMKARYICTLFHTKRLVLLIWLASLCLALPIVKFQILQQVGSKRIGYWCVKEWYSVPTTAGKVYEVYMLLLILVCPLAAMIFAYSSICCELWTVMSTRGPVATNCECPSEERKFSRFKFKMPSTNIMMATSVTSGGQRRMPLKVVSHNAADENSTKKQVIKMLVAIVALFAVCWTPAMIDNVLVAFDKLDRISFGSIRYARQAFAVMSYANSCVNPVVYAFMSKNFRAGFRKTLVCGGRTSGSLGGGQRSSVDSHHRGGLRASATGARGIRGGGTGSIVMATSPGSGHRGRGMSEDSSRKDSTSDIARFPSTGDVNGGASQSNANGGVVTVEITASLTSTDNLC